MPAFLAAPSYSPTQFIKLITVIPCKLESWTEKYIKFNSYDKENHWDPAHQKQYNERKVHSSYQDQYEEANKESGDHEDLELNSSARTVITYELRDC